MDLSQIPDGELAQMLSGARNRPSFVMTPKCLATCMGNGSRLGGNTHSPVKSLDLANCLSDYWELD